MIQMREVKKNADDNDKKDMNLLKRSNHKAWFSK